VTDILDRIRSSCAAVADRSTHVRIDPTSLAAFADRLDTTMPEPDPGQVRIGDDESTAAFVLALDSINFGSGWFPYLSKREGMSGYHTIATSLREFAADAGPITAPLLIDLTSADCARVFGQRVDDPMQFELMGLFAAALHDLGHFVQNRGDGSFTATVGLAGGSAAALVSMLDEMPFFHDVHVHCRHEVFLYKRAQIVAQDLAIAFNGCGPGHFNDIDRLTMFADNLVPHVLRVEGALVFSPELLDRIAAVDDIEVGSAPEVEIRACAITAVELLRQCLRDRGVAITSADLDNILWNLGAVDRYKSVLRHRTRCVFY